VQVLGDHGKARFLQGPVLDAMQHVVPEDIELHRLRIERRAWTDTERGTNASSKPIQRSHEQYVMTIQGRNYGDAERMQALRQGILQHPYFKERLRPHKPLELDSRQRRQSDPLDPDREFSLFTLQCFFEERTPTAKALPTRKTKP
jgi:hypothetical protein